jgi:hypothetical protein
MSRVSKFTIDTGVRSACRDALKRRLPSDVLFSTASALWEHSQKEKTIPQLKKFYRDCAAATVKAVRELERIEEKADVHYFD